MDCPECKCVNTDIADIDGDLLDVYKLNMVCTDCGYDWSVDCQAEIIKVNK
jgi:hypothetical protein